jgi:hypothetical protein
LSRGLHRIPLAASEDSNTMTDDEGNRRRPGVVSVWVGAFPSIEAAEAYFGIPDEIGVYLPPDGFAGDVSIADVPPECLEVNFEQLAPRPLGLLLQDATYSASFVEQVVVEGGRQGVREAQGVALLYDFEYRLPQGRGPAAGPLRFIGSFPFVRTPDDQGPSEARFDVVGPMDYVL